MCEKSVPSPGDQWVIQNLRVYYAVGLSSLVGVITDEI